MAIEKCVFFWPVLKKDPKLICIHVVHSSNAILPHPEQGNAREAASFPHSFEVIYFLTFFLFLATLDAHFNLISPSYEG